MKRQEAEELLAGIERGLTIIGLQEQRQISIDLFMVLTAVLASIASLLRANGHRDLFDQVQAHHQTLTELLQANCIDEGEDPPG